MILLLLATALAQAPVSPHGDPDGCASCHVVDDGEVGAPRPVVATCRGCHPTADMHPVGIAPKDVAVPAPFSLVGGELVCSTCHAEPAHGGTAAALPPPWWVGGPYAAAGELCARCHAPQTFQRTNPHTGRDGPRGACSACHTTAPEPGAGLADAALRVAVDRGCATCHTGPVHAGAAEHVGRRVPPAVAARLPAAIALDDGRIACVTCHEVHDGSGAGARWGRLPRALHDVARATTWSRVPAEATWPGHSAEALLALPLAGDALCSACHGDGGLPGEAR